MELTEFPNFNRLLHRVRRKEWAAVLRHQLELAFCCSAAILSIAGLWHTLVQSLSRGFVAMIAAFPLLIGLVHGLARGRPSLSTAAAIADTQWNCHELMSTALWQSSLPPNQQSAWVEPILSQAEQRARCTRKEKWHWRPRGSEWLLLGSAGAAAMGILLLSTSGTLFRYGSDTPRINAAESQLGAKEEGEPPFAELTDLLAQNERVNSTQQRESSHREKENKGSTMKKALPAFSAETSEIREAPPGKLGEDKTRGVDLASSVVSGGDKAGDHAGRLMEARGDYGTEEKGELDYHDIEREKGTSGILESAPLADKTVRHETGYRGKVWPARHADTRSGLSYLNAPLRNYADAYLALMRKAP
jgi:hypothetical protein